MNMKLNYKRIATMAPLPDPEPSSQGATPPPVRANSEDGSSNRVTPVDGSMADSMLLSPYSRRPFDSSVLLDQSGLAIPFHLDAAEEPDGLRAAPAGAVFGADLVRAIGAVNVKDTFQDYFTEMETAVRNDWPRRPASIEHSASTQLNCAINRILAYEQLIRLWLHEAGWGQVGHSLGEVALKALGLSEAKGLDASDVPRLLAVLDGAKQRTLLGHFGLDAENRGGASFPFAPNISSADVGEKMFTSNIEVLRKMWFGFPVAGITDIAGVHLMIPGQPGAPDTLDGCIQKYKVDLELMKPNPVEVRLRTWKDKTRDRGLTKFFRRTFGFAASVGPTIAAGLLHVVAVGAGESFKNPDVVKRDLTRTWGNTKYKWFRFGAQRYTDFMSALQQTSRDNGKGFYRLTPVLKALPGFLMFLVINPHFTIWNYLGLKPIGNLLSLPFNFLNRYVFHKPAVRRFDENLFKAGGIRKWIVWPLCRAAYGIGMFPFLLMHGIKIAVFDYFLGRGSKVLFTLSSQFLPTAIGALVYFGAALLPLGWVQHTISKWARKGRQLEHWGAFAVPAKLALGIIEYASWILGGFIYAWVIKGVKPFRMRAMDKPSSRRAVHNERTDMATSTKLRLTDRNRTWMRVAGEAALVGLASFGNLILGQIGARIVRSVVAMGYRVTGRKAEFADRLENMGDRSRFWRVMKTLQFWNSGVSHVDESVRVVRPNLSEPYFLKQTWTGRLAAIADRVLAPFISESDQYDMTLKGVWSAFKSGLKGDVGRGHMAYALAEHIVGSPISADIQSPIQESDLAWDSDGLPLHTSNDVQTQNKGLNFVSFSRGKETEVLAELVKFRLGQAAGAEKAAIDNLITDPKLESISSDEKVFLAMCFLYRGPDDITDNFQAYRQLYPAYAAVEKWFKIASGTEIGGDFLSALDLRHSGLFSASLGLPGSNPNSLTVFSLDYLRAVIAAHRELSTQRDEEGLLSAQIIRDYSLTTVPVASEAAYQGSSVTTNGGRSTGLQSESSAINRSRIEDLNVLYAFPAKSTYEREFYEILIQMGEFYIPYSSGVQIRSTTGKGKTVTNDHVKEVAIALVDRQLRSFEAVVDQLKLMGLTPDNFDQQWPLLSEPFRQMVTHQAKLVLWIGAQIADGNVQRFSTRKRQVADLLAFAYGDQVAPVEKRAMDDLTGFVKSRLSLEANVTNVGSPLYLAQVAIQRNRRYEITS